MELTTDELDYIYEALSLSFDEVENLETTPANRAQASHDLRALLKKVGTEITHRL